MKWKGRRQSTNLEDRSKDKDLIADFLEKNKEAEGPRPTPIKQKDQKLPKKNIPVPTSAEDARKERQDTIAKRIQVTPGEWKTSNN
jgi:hypothetical protein